MAELTDIQCPHCDPFVKKYKYPHRVYARSNEVKVPDSIAQCEWCGGHFTGDKWIYRCIQCGKDVNAGGLQGLFVPHSCSECSEKSRAKDRAEGSICRSCRKPYFDCYC